MTACDPKGSMPFNLANIIMFSFFLDPNKPLSTCTSDNCSGCPLQEQLQCHFGALQLLRFFAIAFPPFILGGVGITRINPWMLVPWIGIAIAYFGFIEIRVMCSHCPHYAEPGSKTLQCWANYGSPKLWKYRPGPMSRGENAVFFAGLILIAGYPTAFMVYGQQWLLFGFFCAAAVWMAGLMGRLMCSRCMNFACPFNGVAQNVREMFSARNPGTAMALSEPDINKVKPK